MTQIARKPATGTKKVEVELSVELVERLTELGEVKGHSLTAYIDTVLYEHARRRRPR